MDYVNSEDANDKMAQNAKGNLTEKYIIGDPSNGQQIEVHPIFSELSEFYFRDGEHLWRETARWIKYEENVEEGGNRWSKPHVSTVSLHSLFELRSYLLNGAVILNCNDTNLEQIFDTAIETMANGGMIKSPEIGDRIKDILLQRHQHQHQRNPSKSLMRSLMDLRQSSSISLRSQTKINTLSTEVQNNAKLGDSGGLSGNSSRQGSSADLKVKLNQQFMRKIPNGAESNNILVSEVDFLDKAICILIRLSRVCELENITEVPVPTRFIFIFMGPHTFEKRYHEVGRAFGTLMSDQIFGEVVYKVQTKDQLLMGVDEYLDAVTVLPPGIWDPNIRIEPPEKIPTQEERMKSRFHDTDFEMSPEELERLFDKEEEIEREKNGLKRTGRLFGGLMNDIKRKTPWYWSDFKDAFSLQSIATIFFLYFACLTPIITFGGLLGDATGNNIATMESLMSGCLCGVIYGFFSGQPLTIVGSTGPVLVFETILYDFCNTYEYNYLTVRLWIGLWAAAILFLFVAFDASAFVCYITRFTEENFSTLISMIFLYKAIEKLLEIKRDNPINTHPDAELNYNCSCIYDDGNFTQIQYKFRNESAQEYCINVNGTLFGDGCVTPRYVSDVFFFSVILFIATFVISIKLKGFKTSSFLPTKYRSIISDFAVPIGIISVSAFDNYIGLDTPKLLVPSEFKPTLPTRGWIVPPFESIPWWISIAAVFPALLVTILIFMDQQITAVIVNRKENKLLKGGGYHLDLFVLTILITLCSLFGLPWFVAATVLSMNHVNSLKKESECAAPGDKPQFLGVREQRVTHIVIFILCGLSILFTKVLQRIPMPVLYGVFLYMGTSTLNGSQFFERILIMFMPQKYQPDYMFLRQVPTKKVHLFTCIQLLCFALLWAVKSYKPISIAFPVMLVVMLIIRKLLDYVFTRNELKILDDIMPETTKRKKHDELEKRKSIIVKAQESLRMEEMKKNNEQKNAEIQLANGNVLKFLDATKKGEKRMNITEQLAKSNAWKCINEQNYTCNGATKRADKSDAKIDDETKALNENSDDDDDVDDDVDCGITIKIN